MSLCYFIVDYDEVGWKIIYADVFRFLLYKSWFCVIFGKLCFLIFFLNRIIWDFNYLFKVLWKLFCVFGNFLWLFRYWFSIYYVECLFWWWFFWVWLMYISRVMYIIEVFILVYLLFYRCRILVFYILFWYYIFGFVGFV